MSERCPRCNKNLALVGRAHNCVILAGVNNGPAQLIPLPHSNDPVGRPIGPGGRASSGPALNANALRQAKWREANIETQRERSRSSMRKLREKAK